MKSKDIKISPSILAADFGHLADEVKRLEDAGADALHLDIMDGHFVPNLTMGPQIVSAIRRSTSLFIEAHLMIYNPYDYVERFVAAGADMITIHFEATEDVEETLKYIRKCNVKAGLAFNPETSDSFVVKFLDRCDMIHLMTVNPGFGGQDFIPETLDTIRFVRDMCDTLHIRAGGVTAQNDDEKRTLPPFDIQVDGGITAETAPSVIDAGANILVSGTYLFKQKNLCDGIARLRACGQ